MLDRGAIPAVDDIERSSSLTDLRLPGTLLERGDKARIADVRLVTQQALTRSKGRRVLAEQTDIGSHAKMRPGVPDDVPAVVAHRLNLSASNPAEPEQR